MNLIGMARMIPQRLRKPIHERLFKPTEIHVERIERTYEKLSKWLEWHKETMLMLTFSPKPPSEVTLKLYKNLMNQFNNPVGLHTHICDDLYSPTLPLPSLEAQYERIETGIKHLSKLEAKTTDFTSGHWSYNYDTFIACRKLGLINVHIRLKYIPEITYKYGIPSGINIIPVARHLHDYDI